MNVMAPAIFIAAMLTFLWPHVHGTGALVALALLYGAFAGAFAAIIGAPMIAFGDSTDVGRRTGMYLTILSLGSLAGPPISGAINRATGGYSVVGIYAGLFSSCFPPLFCSLSGPRSALTVVPWLLFLSLTRVLRIHHDGCFGTPRPVPLLRTGEMERESIEESPGRDLSFSSKFLLASCAKAYKKAYSVDVPYYYVHSRTIDSLRAKTEL